MKKLLVIQRIIILLLFVFLFQFCEDRYERYLRPEWLEKPIYSQLKERGDCNSFITCIEKAGYKDILDKAGYYTIFVPNDEAFKTFLQQKGLSSVNELDSATAKDIVTFCLVYNAYNSNTIDDYQSSKLSALVPDKAFKRQTAYSKWVYPDTVSYYFNGIKLYDTVRYVIDQNGLSISSSNPNGNVNFSSKNNKYISYFTNDYLKNNNVQITDYNYFFPNTEFTGFNVLDAKVLEKDLRAENGFIYIIDKVLTPLPNLEDFLKSNPDYSEFKQLIDVYCKTFSPTTNVNDIIKKSTGKIIDTVFMKLYSGMYVAPNCENYLRYDPTYGETYDAQINGYTMFVPNNAAVEEFYSKLYSHYSKNDISPALIKIFINAHMFTQMVWPSKYQLAINNYGENPRFDFNTDIIEAHYASNGIFYGVNKVQYTNTFYSVYGEIILDPNYSLMWQAIETADIAASLISDKIKFTVFLIPNDKFKSSGIDYTSDGWTITNPDLGTNGNTAVIRMLKMHIIENKLIENLTPNTVVKTIGDDYIRFSNYFVWGAGNDQAGVKPFVKSSDTIYTNNGILYKLNNPIIFSNKNVGFDLERKFGTSLYMKYILKATEIIQSDNSIQTSTVLYDKSTQALGNVKTTADNTIFVPTDAAINAAVNAGLLPPLTASYFNDAQANLVYNFVMYHIVAGSIITNDGVGAGLRSTQYMDIDGKTYVSIDNTDGKIVITDNKGRKANWVSNTNNTNIISNRAIIHQIDNYLDYRKE
jgi:uncharacterized surface protein with fasciclin (FAS1) repeats